MNDGRWSAAVVVVGLVAACGGGGGGDGGPAGPTSPGLHAISGTVTGAPHTTIALAGAVTATTQVDRGGRYRFAGLADGQYTVTASLQGYSFSPVSTAVELSGADRGGVDFVGTAHATPTYAIAGTVSGAAHATITLTGAATASAIADSSGHYRFAGLVDGTYQVTPSRSGYRFSPASATISVAGADRGDVDFTGIALHTISGKVSPTGPAITRVNVIVDGETTSFPVAADGSFSIPGLPDDTYSVWIEIPRDATQWCANNNVGGQFEVAGADASVTLAPDCVQSVEGTLSPARAGLVVRLSGGPDGTVYTETDSSGRYIFGWLSPGSYTVATDWPSTSGPRVVDLGIGNVRGVDFTVEQAGSVVLFASASYTGNLGGRAGADARCALAAPSVCASSAVHVRAILSVSTTDTVAAMPVSYGLPTQAPLRQPGGALVATNWQGMFSALLASPLEASPNAWTGSTKTGDVLQNYTCNGWTTSGTNAVGQFGDSMSTTAAEEARTWLWGGGFSCSVSLPLICACW